jgi:quercetin dioxygenase-like cupin family protein
VRGLFDVGQGISNFHNRLATGLGDQNERLIMKNKPLMFVLLFLMAGTLMAQQPAASQAPHASVTPLTSKDLPEFPGKEVLMITVEYPPGTVDPIHRHNAHAFVYLLEGSIIMQVKGGKEVTLTPGQTFYEGPDDVHVVGRNASSTKPAKFVVFFIKDKGAPVLVPAPE